MNDMNTRQASEISGVSQRMIGYWVKQNVIQPTAHYGQGKASVFNFRALVLLRLAGLMRKGYTLTAVKKALALVSEKWQGEDPAQAGILVLDYATREFTWLAQPALLNHYVPGASYFEPGFDVARIAREVTEYINISMMAEEVKESLAIGK